MHFISPSTAHRLVGAALALPLLAGSPAAAAPTPEAEPNDSIFQYSGPVGIDGARGTLGTANDLDVFLVRLRPQRQVKITYAIVNRPACTGYSAVNFSLRTPTDVGINAPYGSDDFYSSSVETFTITTPGVFGGPSQDFYLRFWASGTTAVGCQYQFTVAGAAGEATDAIDPTPPQTYPVIETPEPNDIDAQAIGPLAADTLYAGTIETDNDIDLLYVPIKAGTAPTFELQSTGGGVDASIAVRGSTSSREYLSTDDQSLDSETLAVSSTDTTYLVRLDGTTGAKWRLRVTPPLAVGFTPAPPPPPPTPVEPVEPPYVGRQVSLSRTSGRYRGRVTSKQSACNAGVRVTLRRRGKKQTYGTTTTRNDGSWTISRRTLPGKVYASVDYEERSGFACGSDTSRVLKRR